MESFMPKEASSHLIELLDAALPYANGNARHSIELMRKVSDLMISLSPSESPSDLSACNLNTDYPGINMEGLLENLHKVSNSQEKDFIHMILNFVKAKNLYSSYQTFQQTYAPADATLAAATVKNNTPKMNANNLNLILEFLMSQLSPEQQKNFEMMQSLLH